MRLPPYSVKAHTSFFTVREEGSGDIATFPITASIGPSRNARSEADALCDKLNRAYSKGYRSGQWDKRNQYEADDGAAINDGPGHSPF